MKKFISVICFILVVVMSLSGCTFVISETVIGGGSDGDYEYDDGPVKEEPALAGELEIQIWTNESEDMTNAWTYLIDEFEEDTGLDVTAYIGSHVNTKLQSRWENGNPPDLALLNGSLPVEGFEEKGYLKDLKDLLQNGYVYGTEKKIWDVTYHDIHQRYDEDSPYYRAGFVAAPYGVLYDNAYLKSLGLQAPENYTQLQTFSQAVIDSGNAVFTTYGNTGSYPTWSMIMPAIAAYGQEYLDDVLKGSSEAWQRAEVKAVLQRWRDFCNTKGVLVDGTSSFDHTTSQIKWLNHESALIGNGIWLPAEVRNVTPPDFDMQFVTSPLTLEDQKPVVLAGGNAMLMASKAKNVENAEAFIRYLYTKKAQAILTSGFGYMGARTDMDYVSVSGMSDAAQDILSYIYSDKVDILWQRYTWGTLNDAVNAATHGLMTGSMTVDEAVKRIVDMAKQLGK